MYRLVRTGRAVWGRNRGFMWVLGVVIGDVLLEL